MNSKFVLCLTLALSLWLPGSLPASAGLKEVVVAPGDTLSQIAERQGLPLVILQNVNRIQNSDAFRDGTKLLVPDLEWLAEPFLKSGEIAANHIRTGYVNKTNLLVGLDAMVTNADEEPFRFLAIQLAGTNRSLIFNSEKEGVGLERWHVNTWSFIDLDGDGDSDILSEHEEGSEHFVTVTAFHYDGQKYHQYNLADDIATGFVEHRKNKNGAAVIYIYERDTGQLTAIDWEQFEKTNLAMAMRVTSTQPAGPNFPSLEVEQIGQHWEMVVRLCDESVPHGTNVTCAIFTVSYEGGKESHYKLADIPMSPVDGDNGYYVGIYSNGKELSHGTKVLAEYRNPKFERPAQATTTMLYH